jgi:hypothetical protein
MASFDMALVDEEALMGLEESQGDLLHALAAVERHRRERQSAAESGELIGRAIGLAKEGKLKGLRIRLGDRTVRELPLPKGSAGAVIGAALSTLLSQLSVDLVKKEPEEEPAEELE